ncbi:MULTISPECIES: pyridoxal phosphate-dependent aminotransferase [unclassified Chelatococcus]|uniref:pyridoxal phosphate-dependent aminotransferase n=1 Tax=unclassified Chelatococcus TaxID=2638111 RepID=UPI001BCDAC86|nr:MULTISPECIES: pyridoxal phosphate-dependent aminotransferase [unclassified Chelatococcus]CAH1654169.1 Aminotransferase [Hyphomicrobiales bacterium]MBS7742817.1 pyridoxal phosphate-dependent aminotransferase [Chelatococcus sp. HY11]MBX3542065.1 pyridoxal phosphate-dependent aminotransferase [Chelatococcus sp.]MCO5074043.1 pyridoxal phosphate-dependent aminotransferase [Chelatococcus sp.]CAH1694799.1 Aminotransferase [Hyphomicrobiales bacterium]
MTNARTRNRYFDELFSTPDLAWMGQNTNHVPAHPAVVEAMIRSVEAGEFNAYAPPMGFEALRSAIVTDLGTPSGEALVTEGGVNALAMICKARAKPGTTLVTTDPTWKWPCLFAEQAGAEVVQIPIYTPETDFKLTPEALRASVDERCAIIYLVDPNNPLGVRYERSEIEAFAEIARSVGALLIHDCTYRDFADGHTPVLRVAPEGTVVSLSFSKWLGLAGMRIGALVAEPRLVDEFSAASTSVLGASVVAQRAAMAGLSVKSAWMREVRGVDRANKAMIIEAAERAGLCVPIPVSHGNFLVLETVTTGVAPEAIVEAARREGVMIRQGRYHTAAFGDRFIKVSTSVPGDWAERFCEGLPRYIETARTLNDVPALF